MEGGAVTGEMVIYRSVLDGPQGCFRLVRCTGVDAAVRARDLGGETFLFSQRNIEVAGLTDRSHADRFHVKAAR